MILKEQTGFLGNPRWQQIALSTIIASLCVFHRLPQVNTLFLEVIRYPFILGQGYKIAIAEGCVA